MSSKAIDQNPKILKTNDLLQLKQPVIGNTRRS